MVEKQIATQKHAGLLAPNSLPRNLLGVFKKRGSKLSTTKKYIR